MAYHYIKFEVFIPTNFKDSESGEGKQISANEIDDFCYAIGATFGGFTQSNPVQAPPFKGWWISKNVTYIDYPISIFTLISLEKESEAIKFFSEWKTKLEKRLNQEFILVCFHSIQILGKL